MPLVVPARPRVVRRRRHHKKRQQVGLVVDVDTLACGGLVGMAPLWRSDAKATRRCAPLRSGACAWAPSLRMTVVVGA